MYINDEETEDVPHCLECGDVLYGRSDKKFCDATCRNAWHAHIRSGKRTYAPASVSPGASPSTGLQRITGYWKTCCA